MFEMHSSGLGGVWRVIKFGPPHVCRLNPDTNAPRQVGSKTVGRYYAARQFNKTTALCPAGMADEICKEFGFDISYNLALKSKHIAVGHTYGDHCSSFSSLPSYLHQLKLENPGTHTALATADDNSFK